MGLIPSFSFGSKKEKSTATGSFNTSTTATVPAWLQQQTDDLLATNNRLAGANPQNYVAGSNPLLDRAQAGADGLSGTPWAYDGATDIARGVSHTSWADPFVSGSAPKVQSQSVLDNLGSYMSPYTDRVLDATLADFDHNAGRTRAQ